MMKVTTASSDYFASIFLPPHNIGQRINEEWDILINIHRLGI